MANPIKQPICLTLTGARFIDVRKGRLFPLSTWVRCRGGRIQELGSGPMPETEPGEARIDLGKRFVTPGLINTHCHTHLTLPAMLMGFFDLRTAVRMAPQQRVHDMAECVGRGITTVRDAWHEDLSEVRALSARIENGDIPGPRIHQAVVVSMEGAVWSPRRGWLDRVKNRIVGLPFVDFADSRSGVVAFPADADGSRVREAVDIAVAERGAHTIKVYEQRAEKVTFKPGRPLMSQAQFDALVDQAHHHGLPTTLHHLSVESFRRGMQAGVRSFAHGVIDAELSPDQIEAFVASGRVFEPTVSMSVMLAWKMKGNPHNHAPALDRLDAFRASRMPDLACEFFLPELAPIVVEGLERARRGKHRLFGFIDMGAPFRFHRDIISRGMANILRLYRAGATFATGNDGGVPPVTPAMLGLELEVLSRTLAEGGVGGGLTGEEALRMATLNSALSLGMHEELGSIETGKLADLVVYDGNPLTDPLILGSRAAAVFKEGRLVVNRCGLESG